MKKIRVSAIAVVLAVGSIVVAKANSILGQRVTFFWYNADDQFVGTSTTLSTNPLDCDGTVDICATAHATQNPASPVLTTVFIN